MASTFARPSASKTDGKANPLPSLEVARGTALYAIDFVQRSILLWDTLRHRGNNFIGHERKGLLPVLHFEYETIMDGRTRKRLVNYALLRIVPPKASPWTRNGVLM